jgi:plastocyanin
MTTSVSFLCSRRKTAAAALAAASFAAVGLAACGGTKTTSSSAATAGTTTTMPMPAPVTTGPPPSAASAVATPDVMITNFAFSPAVVTIKAGTTVTWTNKDEEPHTVFSSSANMKSATLAGTTNTFSHTFSTPGTFAYNCTIHPFMHGTVVVTA